MKKLPQELLNFIKDKKIENFNEWLVTHAEKAKQRKLTTHNSKYTHPNTGIGDENKKNGTYVTPIIFNGSSRNDGLVRSGNVISNEIDSTGNAQLLKLDAFLRCIINDKSILNHIQENTDIAKRILSNDNVIYEKIKKNLLEIFPNENKKITSSRIKQVYFPIFSYDKIDYHLLSTLTNSTIFSELKKRLRDINKIKDNTQENTSLQYKKIYNLTLVYFGGKHPKNIGYLNNKEAGEMYLLSSAPPVLSNLKIKIPTTDFFTQSLKKIELKQFFENFNYLLHQENQLNKKEFIEKLNNIINDFLDIVLKTKRDLHTIIKSNNIELSKDVPEHQRNWILSNINDNHHNIKGFKENLVDDISRSLIALYEKSSVIDNIPLSNNYLNLFNKIIGKNIEVLA